MIIRGRYLVAILVALFGVWFAATAAPDLVISHIEIQPGDPLPGEMTTLFAVIQNVGSTDVEDSFFVRFLIDGNEVDALSVPPGIGPNRSRTLTTQWPADPGAHILEVQVDQPLNRVPEGNETNNLEMHPFVVRFATESAGLQNTARIVVSPFEDTTRSGFINVGKGTADALATELERSGLRVLELTELEAVMQSSGLDPSSIPDLAEAARRLNADMLIRGEVEDLNLAEASIQVGFLRLSSASVDVRVSAEVIDPFSEAVIAYATAEGTNEGKAGFSVNLDIIRALSDPSAACISGFRSEESWYSISEPIPFRFMNHGPPVWYGVEIHSSTDTFLRWLGWEFVDTGECGAWYWDQRDSLGSQLGPGLYYALLWDGTSFIDSVAIQIRPGMTVEDPPVDEITFGQSAFRNTLVGSAIDSAIADLAGSLLPSITAAPVRAGENASLAMQMTGGQPVGPVGQIASFLPDGRVAINLGASDGVTRGEFFEVLEAENVIVDPISLEILEYTQVAIKGELVITEVRERVSYGLPTTDFVPTIGDVVRIPQP